MRKWKHLNCLLFLCLTIFKIVAPAVYTKTDASLILLSEIPSSMLRYILFFPRCFGQLSFLLFSGFHWYDNFDPLSWSVLNTCRNYLKLFSSSFYNIFLHLDLYLNNLPLTKLFNSIYFELWIVLTVKLSTNFLRILSFAYRFFSIKIERSFSNKVLCLLSHFCSVISTRIYDYLSDQYWNISWIAEFIFTWNWKYFFFGYGYLYSHFQFWFARVEIAPFSCEHKLHYSSNTAALVVEHSFPVVTSPYYILSRIILLEFF